MAWVPAAMAVAGAFQQGVAKRNADKYNAAAATNEANISVDQGNAQEGQVIRSSREALARQTAAFGASGAGYGGSSATALDQSAVNQEMDALDTRYKGTLTAYGYQQKARLDNSEANSDEVQGGLTAGAALLKGMGYNYSMAPQTTTLSTGWD